jgi:uroporphyrinogen-III synthase
LPQSSCRVECTVTVIVILQQALERTPVASVGPVVSDELKAYGFKSDITPDNDAFFMRPLISAMAARLAKTQPRVRGKA